MNIKSFLLGAAFLFFFAVSNAQKAGSALFNGAWRSVDNKGFTVMHASLVVEGLPRRNGGH